MRREPVAADTTEDAVLGGRLTLRQPRRGHRVGHDAILLAAATGAEAGELAVDFGAGVGAAGLALAARVPGLAVTLVEIDPALAALAADNIRRNRLDARVRAVALDATAGARAFAAAGLPPGAAARVLMNPPFNDRTAGNVSPDAGRRLAHAAAAGIAAWLRSAGRVLAARGSLTLIWRADGLADVLAVLARGFGGIAVQPVHPRPDAPAIRVLVRAVKGSRAPLSLLPGLVLADADGRPSGEAEAVLRHGAALPLAACDVV
ncbi:MAG TPA: methyltransferase [Xanthobacteraceae bacterium]|nr:methyltransferase [Xanthobacteraceae bacterium]